jgi:hypothetical protein
MSTCKFRSEYVRFFSDFLTVKRKISGWWVQTRRYCNILVEMVGPAAVGYIVIIKSLFNRTEGTHVISPAHLKMRKMRPIALISPGRPILVVIVCFIQ